VAIADHDRVEPVEVGVAQLGLDLVDGERGVQRGAEIALQDLRLSGGMGGDEPLEAGGGAGCC
jgi:hypothetical protein